MLWLAGSFLLSWYLENIADYDAVYGTLGAAIGLMMWLWLSAIAVLFGAELNAGSDQTARNTTTSAPKSLDAGVNQRAGIDDSTHTTGRKAAGRK